MTDEQRIAYILRGHRIYWDTLGKMRGNQNHKGDICWLSGGLYYSYSLRMNGTDYDSQIRSIAQRIQDKEIPDNVTILPDSAPNDIDLLDAFLKTGLFEPGYTALGMAKTLHVQAAFPEPDQGVVVRRIQDVQQLKMGGAILNAAFEYDLFSFEHYLDAYYMGEVAFYIAEHSGLPVGACMSIAEDTAIEIAWVGVLPGYRKKGIAGQLICAAERDAMQAGKSISVLSAFAGAVHAYQRVGYNPYCKIEVINYSGRL